MIKNITASFKTRHFKYGGYATLLTLAVAVAVVLANLVIGRLSLQFDLTSQGFFSLSPETMQVLNAVKTPVKFYGIWQPGGENREVMPVINLYLYENRNISFEVVDPDRNPGFVSGYDRDGNGISTGSLIVQGEK